VILQFFKEDEMKINLEEFPWNHFLDKLLESKKSVRGIKQERTWALAIQNQATPSLGRSYYILEQEHQQNRPWQLKNTKKVEETNISLTLDINIDSRTTNSMSQPTTNTVPDQELQAEHTCTCPPVASTSTNPRSRPNQILSPKTARDTQSSIDPVVNTSSASLFAVSNNAPTYPIYLNNLSSSSGLGKQSPINQVVKTSLVSLSVVSSTAPKDQIYPNNLFSGSRLLNTNPNVELKDKGINKEAS
jgi:hypothetical protein